MLYSQVVPVVVRDSAILRDPYTMKIIFSELFTQKLSSSSLTNSVYTQRDYVYGRCT